MRMRRVAPNSMRQPAPTRAIPACTLKAATGRFSWLGLLQNTNAIANYCAGPSAGATVEPISPDEGVVIDGDELDGQPGGTGGCSGGDATAGCGGSTSGGDPVRLYTGQFHLVAHDLHLADTTIALDLARVYRSSAYDTSGRPMAGAFGIGTTFNYDSYLTLSAADSSGVRQSVQLYLPSGIRVTFTLRAGPARRGTTSPTRATTTRPVSAMRTAPARPRSSPLVTVACSSSR